MAPPETASRPVSGGAARALAIATLGAALSMGVVGSGSFSIFMVPLQQSFGWGRGDISIAHAITVVIVAMLAPFAGAAADRWGIRRVLLPSLLGFGLAMASAALMTGSLAHLYLTYALIGLFGVGATPLLFTRVIVQWFTARRGLALGIAMSGIGVGQTLLLPALERVAAAHGWRVGYLLIGGAVVLLLWPVCALWFREPGAGRHPDSAPPAARDGRAPWREILSRRLFWQLAAGFFAPGLYTGGILTHVVPMLGDRGVSPGRVAMALSIMGFTLFVSRILTGLLLDRVDSRYVTSICLCFAVVGIAMLAVGASGSTAILAAALVSFAVGAEMDFLAFLVRQYFPLAIYGQVYGLLYGALMIGAGAGPLLMGFSHQLGGDYGIALWLLCAISVIATALFASLPRAGTGDSGRRPG